MIALYWLRSLFRVAPGRTLATAAGIALAVAFAATLAIFVVSASYTMTARAIANVPVDWQVELGAGNRPDGGRDGAGPGRRRKV